MERKGKAPKQLDRVSLLERFASPLVLVTYQGILQVDAVRNVSKFDMTIEGAGKAVTLGKKQCLVAMSGSSLGVVKSLITRRKDIAGRELKAKNLLWRREMVRRLPMKCRVRLTLRNGLVMEGRFVSVDKFQAVFELGEEPLLVWKHGIHHLAQLEPEPVRESQGADASVAKECDGDADSSRSPSSGSLGYPFKAGGPVEPSIGSSGERVSCSKS